MLRKFSARFTRIILPTATHYGIHYFFTFFIVLNGLLLTSFGAHTLNKYLMKFWAKMLFWTMGRRVVVRNREFIEPGKSYLAVMNHSSLFDIPAVMTFIPDGSWVGRDKLLKIPVFGKMLERTNYIPIDTLSWRKSLEAIKKASANASEGMTVLIFPEGTRTQDGNIQNFSKGFVRIMKETGVDILPITINGLFTWKAKYQKYINTTEPIEIIINKPVEAAQLNLMDDGEIIVLIKSIIESSYLGLNGG